jgi:hypothetical protein
MSDRRRLAFVGAIGPKLQRLRDRIAAAGGAR